MVILSVTDGHIAAVVRDTVDLAEIVCEIRLVLGLRCQRGQCCDGAAKE